MEYENGTREDEKDQMVTRFNHYYEEGEEAEEGQKRGKVIDGLRGLRLLSQYYYCFFSVIKVLNIFK